MPSLTERIDGWFASYGAFVAKLEVRSLVLLAIVTASAGMTFVMNLQLPSVKKEGKLQNGAVKAHNSPYIEVVAAVYIIGISVFIAAYRRKKRPNPPPHLPPPSKIPHILIFLKTGFPVSALAFFTALDDPLKSIKSFYVPAICVCCYFHILVILAVLRRREDYGISDGCLAAAYGLLFSMTDSIWLKILLIVPTIGLRA